MSIDLGSDTAAQLVVEILLVEGLEFLLGHLGLVPHVIVRLAHPHDLVSLQVGV